jgi:hypothetical protein
MAPPDQRSDDPTGIIAQADALIATLRTSVNDDPEPVKADLVALATGPEGSAVRDHLESIMSGELLPVQWELEEVLESAAPPPVEAPEPDAPPTEPAAEEPAAGDEAEEPAAGDEAEAEGEEAERPLTSADLNLVYDDPRGLMLHKTKTGERWFATQVDPRTGQPQTFELHQDEITQLQQQLQGSPYWVIGG